MSGDVYPTIRDTRAAIERHLAHAWITDDLLTFAEALASPWAGVDSFLDNLARALVSLDLATGSTLDLAGELVDEQRNGLADHEYRPIVLGKRITIARRRGGFRRPDLFALWLALTGSTVEGAHIGNPSTTTPGIRLRARVDFMPSPTYLRRVGEVLGRAMAPSIGYDAAVHVAGSLTLDSSPGLDEGWLAYAIPEAAA